MKSTPLVTIAVLVHDATHFYRALHSALGQNYPALEVIVSDSSGSPEVARLVEEARKHSQVPLRHHAHKRPLAYPADVNWALGQAKGQYVKFLLGDDWILPVLVARQVQSLEAYPEAGMCSAQRWFADPDSVLLPTRVENFSLFSEDMLLKGGDLLSFFEAWPINFIGSLSCTLLRRDYLKRVVPALASPDSELLVDFDLALYVSVLRHGHLAAIAQTLCAERLEPARYEGVDVTARHNLEQAILVRLVGQVGGERAPWPGSVRVSNLILPPVPEAKREYTELPMTRLLHIQTLTQGDRIGSSARTFAEMYQQWLQSRDFPEGGKALLAERIAGWPSQPQIMPVIIARDDAPGLEATLASVAAQSYAACGCLVLSSAQPSLELRGEHVYAPLQADWAAQLNELLVQLEGFDWFYLLQAGDTLSPHALLQIAERVATGNGLQACYSDEDRGAQAATPEPVFKPAFNLDLLRAYPYVGRAIAFSRQGFAEAGGLDGGAGEAAGADLVLRMAEHFGLGAIAHVADVLLHASQPYASWLAEPSVAEGHGHLLAGHLSRLGQAFEWRPAQVRGFLRAGYLHEQRPLVSILLLSVDNPALMQACLDSLLAKTTYSHYEVIIGVHSSESAANREWLQALVAIGGGRIRVLDQAPERVVGVRYNALAEHAQGDYLLLLSADCRAIEPNWLDELLAHAQRPEIGVTGAKLLGPDGRIEHAGLILGMRGIAGSPFLGEAPAARGYLQRLVVPQNYSAVSQHCMMIRRSLFDSLGGLSDGVFGEHCADVEFCLRVADAGALVVWTPDALLGYRSALENTPQARPGYDLAMAEAYRRWMPRLVADPAYNPNLTLGGSSFGLDTGLHTGWQPFQQRLRPHLLCLPINPGAVGHYRLIQPFHEVERAGLATGLVYHGVPSLTEMGRIRPDSVIFQGRYSARAAEGIESFKRFSDAFRVFELDDYLLDVPGANEHKRFLAKDIQSSLRHSVGLCDRLVVSTQTLAEVMADMSADIRVVPNMLPPERWVHLRGKRGRGEKPRVGWGGGTSHTGDLLLIKDVVRALADEVHWVFFGMCPDELRPYIHEYHGSVPLEQYPAKLASLDFDLAVAPLEQHIFNDCKSNLRLLEYGACGFPVVCTETRSYRGTLPVTLVSSNGTEEWIAAIRSHLADPAASAAQGEALRDTIHRDFMLHGPALQRWLEAWTPG
ncbi:glycosyltransferase [Pseudomonas sp. RIT-PI-S]|uniref:glycosyltransferase n=1 Tax=Pseudomonas sp. RIT-PI-S TaxID=3035295 RepID=UPI0021DA7D45|nr:glycosyltransferase [Pseudomonas sp. RIT-PI-S]